MAGRVPGEWAGLCSFVDIPPHESRLGPLKATHAMVGELRRGLSRLVFLIAINVPTV